MNDQIAVRSIDGDDLQLDAPMIRADPFEYVVAALPARDLARGDRAMDKTSRPTDSFDRALASLLGHPAERA